MAVRGRKNADDVLAVHLAAGLTVEAAARKAHVSPQTVYRRLKDAAFRSAVTELRAHILERAVGKLADASAAAVHTMQRLLKAKSETVRLGAARSILELSCRFREAVELEERVRRLEERRTNGDTDVPTPESEGPGTAGPKRAA